MWEKEKINNLCDILGGKPAPKDNSGVFDINGIPFVRMRDLGRYHLTTNLTETDEKISVEYASNNNLKPIPKGAILLPRSGSVALNHRAILGIDAIIVSHICALKIKDESKINNRFLYYWLTTYDMNKIAKKTTGLDALNFSDLGAIEVSYPDLETQNKIVAILDKAKAILDKREQTIKKYDELMRAVFLDIFGDPVKNEKGWETKSLLEFGDFKNGLNYKSEETGHNVLCLGVGDFKSNWILKNLNSLSKISLENIPSDDYFLQDDDLVFVRSNGNKQLVGRCLLVSPGQEKVTFSGFCIRYRLHNDLISPIYLTHLFRVPTFKSTMLENGRGANIQNINQELLGNLSIPIPSKEYQLEYEKHISQLQISIEKIELFRSKSEELLKSLSQQVFSERITIDVDTELQALLDAIDLDKKDEENKIESVKKDVTFVQRLVDRINEHDFRIKEEYDKAQYVLFRIMKEETNLIKQVLKDEKIHLTLQNETD